MNSQPTKNNGVEITQPIVKISFLWHNREYTIGIARFLREAGINISDEKIQKTIKKILSSQ